MSQPAHPDPAPPVFSRVFSDVAELEASQQGAAGRYCQLQPGKWESGITIASLDQSRVCFGWERLAHLLHCPAKLGLLLTLDCRDQYRCNGHRLHDGTILLCHAGSECFTTATGGAQWIYFVLPPDTLEQVAELAAGGASRVARASCVPIDLESESRRGVTDELVRVWSVLQTSPEILDSPGARRGMEESLFELLLDAPAEKRSIRRRSQGATDSQLGAVARAEEYLRAHLSEPIYLREVCAAIGTTERSLRNAFKQTYGLSPVRYLKVLRLNQVHRALRKAAHGDATVMKIATRFGFWDMSRFAVDYRRLFGESPSQTLRGAGA